jgi:hypothetical protein
MRTILMKNQLTAKLFLIAISIVLCFISINSFCQTNPSPKSIPLVEDFGNNWFSYANLPQGFSIWTSSSSPQSSLSIAASSIPNGDVIAFDSATVIKSTGKTYGYSGLSSGAAINNGKIYIQTSSTNTDQLVMSINTTGYNSIMLSYDVEMLNPQPRAIGITLQYRTGTTGSFKTLDSTYWHNSTDRTQNSFDYFTNIILPSDADDQPVVQIRWATSRSATPSGGSSGVGIDDIVVSGTKSNPLYYRSVTSGLWNSTSTWESSFNNSTWTTATDIPNSGDKSVTIQSGNVVKTTGIAKIVIDDIIVEQGGTLWNAYGTSMAIGHGAGTVDLDVQGTFVDSSNYSVVWTNSSTWRLGTTGTFIKTTNTNSTLWQLRYLFGIVNIPATSNWICRKPAAASVEPSISTTNGGPPNSQVYYGNLYIENNSSSWNSNNLCKFSGTVNYPVIKGNFYIGGNGSGNVNFYNSNINSLPVKLLGDLYINTGSTLSVTGTGMEIQGNLFCSGVYTNISSSSKMLLSGTKYQTINGVGNISTFNLEFNKTGGNITLNNNISVSGNLNLLSGIGYTNTSAKIIMQDNSTTSNASDLSFISGPLQKIGDDAFVFPVGKSGNYQPVTMNGGTNSLVTDAFTAEYFNVNPRTIFGNNLGSGIDSISSCEYWTLTMDIGASQKNVNLTWDGNSCAITSLASLRVARFNQTLWNDEGNLFTTGNTSAGSITSNVTSGFGPFTIATVSTTNSLPITLLSFSAVYNGKEVKLSWVTSAEINNEFFTIEKSRDGKNFEAILTQPGAGNSNRLQYYGAEDLNPYANISYYRLKQTDYDGKFSFSDIIPIRVKIDEPKIISVQASKSNTMISFDVNFPEAANGIIKITDINGKLAYGSKFSSAAQQKHFTIDSSQMPTGVYFLQLYFDDIMIEKKFIY